MHGVRDQNGQRHQVADKQTLDKGIRTSTDLDLRQVMCYERQSCAPQLGVKTLECGKIGDVKSDGECVCSRLRRGGGAGPRERTIEWDV